MVDYPEIDFQDQYYYARPKSMTVKPKSLDEVDPKLLATYEKLGIPLKEQMILARRRRRRRTASRGGTRAQAWRWTRCSTASSSAPPSRRS